jgi:hypothetical protein
MKQDAQIQYYELVNRTLSYIITFRQKEKEHLFQKEGKRSEEEYCKQHNAQHRTLLENIGTKLLISSRCPYSKLRPQLRKRSL